MGNHNSPSRSTRQSFPVLPGPSHRWLAAFTRFWDSPDLGFAIRPMDYTPSGHEERTGRSTLCRPVGHIGRLVSCQVGLLRQSRYLICTQRHVVDADVVDHT